MPKFIIKPEGSNAYIIRYQSSGFQLIHGRSPYPNEETGTWFFFDDEQEKYVDSEYPVENLYDDTAVKQRIKAIEDKEATWDGKQNAGNYLVPGDVATNAEFTDYLGIPNADGGD